MPIAAPDARISGVAPPTHVRTANNELDAGCGQLATTNSAIAPVVPIDLQFFVTTSNHTLEMFSLTLEKFTLFIGAAIIGGCVGLFFLWAKLKPQARPKKATSSSDSRTSGRIADKGTNHRP